MDYIKLRSKQVQERKFKQKTNLFDIRIVDIPMEYDLYYYPKQNLLARYQNHKIHFYSINDQIIQKNYEYTNQFNKYFKSKAFNAFFLKNFIIIDCFDHVKIYNIDNMQFKKFKYCWPYECTQINNKSFMSIGRFSNRLSIYSLRNMKKSHTNFTKQRIASTQYYHLIVQAITQQQRLYYFNTKMTKQIRKIRGYKEYEPIFNSNFLFIPIYQWIRRKQNLIHIKIYDICSMKVNGIIQTKHRQYDSCIFIKDFNVIFIMYSNKLDLYDFNTLKHIGSEKLDDGYEQNMKYDKENGLTIFIERNYSLEE